MIKAKSDKGDVEIQINGTVPVLLEDVVNILRVLDHQLKTSPVPEQSYAFRQLLTTAILEGDAWQPVTGNVMSVQMGYPVSGG